MLEQAQYFAHGKPPANDVRLALKLQNVGIGQSWGFPYMIRIIKSKYNLAQFHVRVLKNRFKVIFNYTAPKLRARTRP